MLNGAECRWSRLTCQPVRRADSTAKANERIILGDDAAHDESLGREVPAGRLDSAEAAQVTGRLEIVCR